GGWVVTGRGGPRCSGVLPGTRWRLVLSLLAGSATGGFPTGVVPTAVGFVPSLAGAVAEVVTTSAGPPTRSSFCPTLLARSAKCRRTVTSPAARIVASPVRRGVAWTGCHSPLSPERYSSW